MDDTQLLHDFVTRRCEKAFAELVNRHINLVYAAARRQCRDAHLADDITQAVFIILARKADTVRSGAVLPAWLLSTARYAASNAISLETTRRRHEQKAAEMKPTSQDNSDSVEEDELTRLLDEALAKLGEKDRAGVAMRFLQGKSMRDVGLAMGTSEEAAQKRVARAVARLREVFVARGISTPADQMLAKLARQSATVAPATLAPLIMSKALTATAAGSAATLAATTIKTTATAIKVKIASMVAASVIVVAAGGVTIKAIQHANAPKPSAAKASGIPAVLTTQPLWVPPDHSVLATGPVIGTFRNDAMLITDASSNGNYAVELDETVRRRPEFPSSVVRSTKPNTTGSAGRVMVTPAFPYHGKRICLSAYFKTKDVAQYVNLALVVAGDNNIELFTDRAGTPILTGTNDWTRVYAVADVPQDAAYVQVGASLNGAGTFWMDDFKIEVVPAAVPTTGEDKWHLFANFPAKFSVAMDEGVKRNGHGTLRLEGRSAIAGQYGIYFNVQRDINQFRGKKLRLSGYLRSQEVLNAAGLYMSCPRIGGQSAVDNLWNKRPIKGSLEWLPYSVNVNVPQDATAIESGIILNGAGRVWLDDLRYEIITP